MSFSGDYNNLYGGVRAAVLGASGFIGRWVAHKLCLQGAKVFLVVRDRLASQEIFSKYAISGEIVEVDCINNKAVRALFQKMRPTITFNLVGYGVDRSERDENTAYLINSRLVEIVSESIAKASDPLWFGQDIVHVGSALEYGAVCGNLSEDSAPNPTTIYAKSKLAGTLILLKCCKSYDIKGLTVRLFTVYGPGEHPGRLLPSLLESAKEGKPLLLTAGHQRRDFTYVEDVAEGILHLGLVNAKPGEIVNLATGRLTPVRDFVETAAQILGIPQENLRFGSLETRSEEMEHSEVTLKRLRQLISWVPSTSIEAGIRKTAEFEF